EQPGDCEIYDGKCAKMHERVSGVLYRHSTCSLVEQDLDVPAERQKGSPEPSERTHGKDGKAYAGKAECRRTDNACQGKTRCEVLDQQREQRSDRKIGNDEEASRYNHDERIPTERYLVESVNDDHSDGKHDDEDAEIWQQLADKSDSGIVS